MLLTRDMYAAFSTPQLTLKLQSFLKRYSHCWVFLYTWLAWLQKWSPSSMTVSWYLTTGSLLHQLSLDLNDGERRVVSSISSGPLPKAISSVFPIFSSRSCDQTSPTPPPQWRQDTVSVTTHLWGKPLWLCPLHISQVLEQHCY